MKIASPLFLCVLLLGGCASPKSTNGDVAPSFQHPWKPDNGIATELVPNIFSKKLGESSELVEKTDLDLALLSDIAFENSPETRRMWHLTQAASARQGQAKSAFYPRATVRLAANRERQENPAMDPPSISYASRLTHPSLSLSYTLFNFGATRAKAKAASENLHAANFQYNRSLQTLLHRVQVGYFAMSAAEATVEAREANLRDATETLNLAAARLEAGLGDKQTFLQAKAGMLQAQFRLEEARATVEKSRSTLAEIVGVPVSKNFHIRRSQLPSNLQCAHGDVEQMVAKTLQRRPDLLAANAQLLATEQLEKAARRDALPHLVAAASGNFGDLVHHGKTRNFDLSIGLSWDLFDGRDKFHRRMERRAQRKIALETLRGEELRAMNEVWSQYFTYLSAYQQLKSSQALLEAALESFTATETAYRSGLSSFLDLLNAQNVLASARESAVAAESHFSTSLATLAYVTGDLEQFCK